MSGYGRASLPALRWGKPERNLMIGFYKHSAPTEPRRRARKASQLRQERDVCSMTARRSISERVQHATEICRRQAASEALKKIGLYKHSAPTEPRRKTRHVGGEPPPEFGRSGYGQASLTALRWGKPERIPNDRALLQTFGSYGAKTVISVNAVLTITPLLTVEPLHFVHFVHFVHSVRFVRFVLPMRRAVG